MKTGISLESYYQAEMYLYIEADRVEYSGRGQENLV